MANKYRLNYRRKVELWQKCDVIIEAENETAALLKMETLNESEYLDDRALSHENRISIIENDFQKVKIEKTAFVAMFSGGRDSSAMTDIICESKRPLDYIIFSDTEAEFSMMYDYVERFREYLKSTYGQDVVILGPRTTFESWVYGKMTKGKQKGMTRGLPKMIDPCFWKRESKIRPVERFMKEKDIINPIKYIGYTNSEKERADVKDPYMRFPLIEEKLCEADVDRRLHEIDMVNILYEFFSRTGCSFCPYMSMKAYYTVYENFKDVWDYMVKVETKLKAMDDVVNDQWSIEKPILEIEKMFESGDHNYDDIPAKACECKI